MMRQRLPQRSGFCAGEYGSVSGGSAVGAMKSSVNVEPSPSSDVTVMSPPMSSESFLEIARPRPVPPKSFVVSEPSTCEKTLAEQLVNGRHAQCEASNAPEELREVLLRNADSAVAHGYTHSRERVAVRRGVDALGRAGHDNLPVRGELDRTAMPESESDSRDAKMVAYFESRLTMICRRPEHGAVSLIRGRGAIGRTSQIRDNLGVEK